MIKPFEGHTPQLHSDARVAENATRVGQVTLDARSRVWYGAVLRADTTTIHVGTGSNLQDGCMVHGDEGFPVQIGRDVTVGHGAILHGCTVGDRCVIGMGATLLNGCVIGADSLVAAGALVTQNTVIPAGSLVMGAPAKVRRALTEEEKAGNLDSAREYEHVSLQLPPAEGSR